MALRWDPLSRTLSISQSPAGSIRASLCTPDTSPHHHDRHRGDGETRCLVGFWTHSRPAPKPQTGQFNKRVGPLLSTWHGWSPCKLVATQRLNLSGLHTGKALSQNEKVLQSYIWLLVLSVPTAPSQNEVLGGKSPPYISLRHLRRESNFREGHKEFLSPSGGILLSLLVL